VRQDEEDQDQEDQDRQGYAPAVGSIFPG